MRAKLWYILLALGVFAFTAFVFLNTYEVLYNRPVAFGVSLRRIAAQSAINNLTHDFSTKPGNADAFLNISHMDDLEAMTVPALGLRVNIESARNVDGTWYQRPSLAGYVPLNKNTQDVAIDHLVFTNASWRTIPVPDRVEVGMDAVFYHKGGSRSNFRIASKVTAPLQQNVLINKTENRQVILLVEAPEDGVYYAFSLEQRV